MNKEKQIEEMAECCPYFWNGACTVDAANPDDCDLMCEMFGFMASLVSAGYRKQSEGEWTKEVTDMWHCSICLHPCLLNGGGDYVLSNYCPHCGAKMKGGAE